MKLDGLQRRAGLNRVFILIGIVTVVYILTPTFNDGTQRFSPGDYGPDGMAALLTFWSRLGHGVEIIDVDEARSLLMNPDKTGPAAVVFTDSPEMARLKRLMARWIEEEGNTVVILGRTGDGTAVHSDPILRLVWGYVEPGFDGPSGLPEDWTRDINELDLRKPVRGVEITTANVGSSADLRHNDPLYLKRHVIVDESRPGRIVAIADARTLTNQHIDRGDHAVLAAQISRYFTADTIVYMIDGKPPRLVQPVFVGNSLPISSEIFWHLALFTGLIMWRVGRRFGSPVDINDTTHRRLIEQVHSVGRLYHRGRAYHKALRIVYEAASYQVARRLGSSGETKLDWKRAERLLGRGSKAEVADWYQLAQKTELILAGNKAAPAEVLQLAQRWEAVRRAAGGTVIPMPEMSSEVEE